MISMHSFCMSTYKIKEWWYIELMSYLISINCCLSHFYYIFFLLTVPNPNCPHKWLIIMYLRCNAFPLIAVDPYLAKRYPRRHAVGNSIPSAIMLRPDLEKGKSFSTSRDADPRWRRSSTSYVDPTESGDFVSPPAIPRPHMPHSALKRYVRSGGDGTHWPRHMTVNTGRDSIKLAQWNDISAWNFLAYELR